MRSAVQAPRGKAGESPLFLAFRQVAFPGNFSPRPPAVEMVLLSTTAAVAATGAGALLLVAKMARFFSTSLSPKQHELQGLKAAQVALGPAPGQFCATTLGTTHYRLEGPAKGPLFVLVHGLGAAIYNWDRITAALVAKGVRVLRYDLYDRGWSETDPQLHPVEHVGVHPLRFDIELYVTQMEDLMRGLGLATAPFAFAGSSTGGAVGIAYAARHPDQVKSLLLLSTVCLPSQTGLVARLTEWPVLGPLVVKHLGPATYLRVSKTMRHDPSHHWHATDLVRVADLLRVNPRYVASIRSTVSYCEGFNHGDLRPEFETVCVQKIPIRLLWGTNDSSTPFKNCVAMYDMAVGLGADVRMHTFEGLPHMIFTEDAAEKECVDIFFDALHSAFQTC